MKRFLLVLILFSAVLFAQKSGEIVFSNSPVNPESYANLTTSFKAGDHIYALATFKKSVRKNCKGRISNSATKQKVEMKVYKNGMYETSHTITFKGDLFKKGKLFVLDIAPSAAGLSAYTNPDLAWNKFGMYKDGPLKFCDMLGNLDEGKTTIKIELMACYEKLAEGEFTIEGADFEFYENLIEGLQNAETQTVKMPKAKKNDPALESEMKSLLKASGNNAWDGDILKVVIIDNDWYIERHKLTGAILFRYIRAEIAIKKSDGCWLYHLATFKQTFEGNTYGKTWWDGAGDRVKIPCENIR